jgi:hypothetical protein
MNNKIKNNKYVSMKRYNNDIYCEAGIITNTDSESRNHMKGSITEENFVSLSAAVRRPFSPAYYFPNYKQPHLDGVN